MFFRFITFLLVQSSPYLYGETILSPYLKNVTSCLNNEKCAYCTDRVGKSCRRYTTTWHHGKRFVFFARCNIGIMIATLFGGQHTSAISSTWMGLMIAKHKDTMLCVSRTPYVFRTPCCSLQGHHAARFSTPRSVFQGHHDMRLGYHAE